MAGLIQKGTFEEVLPNFGVSEILTLSDGSLFAVGTGTVGGQSGVYGLRLSASGDLVGNPIAIDTEMNGSSPDAAVLSDGRIMVAFTGSNGTLFPGAGQEIFARTLSATGSPQGDVFRVNSHSIDHQHDVSIAALPGGNAALTWTSDDDPLGQPAFDIYGQIVNPDTGKVDDDDLVLVSGGTTSQSNKDVLVLNDGTFLAFWQDFNIAAADSGADIVMQRFNTNGDAIGSPVSVAADSDGAQAGGKAVLLENGNIAVTWDGSNLGGVSARIFGQDLSPLSGDITVDGSVRTQVMDITALSDGGFAVGFVESFARTLSNFSDVFVRRFDEDGDAVGTFATPTQGVTGQSRGMLELGEAPNGDLVSLWSVAPGTQLHSTLYNVPLAGGPGPNRLTGTGASEGFAGLGGNDIISGRGGRDYIDGDNGADMLNGGGGGDFVRGGAGRDQINGGGGNDNLSGGAGRDTIEGGRGADEIIGGGGRDVVNGGAGRDEIHSSGGTDRATGGGGADTFVIDTTRGRFVVTDFKGVDDIEIRQSLAGGLTVEELVDSADDSGRHVIFDFGNLGTLVVQNVNNANSLLDDISYF